MTPSLSATLHIVRDTTEGYRVVYHLVRQNGSFAAPSNITGHAKLKAFLRQCHIAPHDIELILARVAADGRYNIDIGYLGSNTVMAFLRHYAG